MDFILEMEEEKYTEIQEFKDSLYFSLSEFQGQVGKRMGRLVRGGVL